MHDEIVLGIVTFLFERFHLVERHSTKDMGLYPVVVTIAQDAASTHKVVQESLPLQGVRII